MNLFQKTLTAIFILAVFSLVIAIFIIEPTIKDIKVFNDRIQIERASLENKYTDRRNVQNIIADFKYVSDAIGPLEEKIIIPKGNEVPFISSLEKIATASGVTQKIQISPATVPAEQSKLAKKQNITIIVSGDYTNSLRYIRELEKSELYIIINSINIISGDSVSSKAAASGNVKAYLAGYVYFSI